MSYKIAALPQTLIEPVWPMITPHLEKVLDLVSDELTLEGIKSKAISGDILILTVCKGPDIIAALTLEIRTYETGLRVLHLPHLGGDEFFEWRPQMDTVVESIAKDFDCHQLRIVGRRGWIKALKDLGWEEHYVVVKKDLRVNQ